MRILIYKRTHTGDPDPERGIFGEGPDDDEVTDCMGKVRGYGFDAVIGVGGFGPEPQSQGNSLQVDLGGHRCSQMAKK